MLRVLLGPLRATDWRAGKGLHGDHGLRQFGLVGAKVGASQVDWVSPSKFALYLCSRMLGLGARHHPGPVCSSYCIKTSVPAGAFAAVIAAACSAIWISTAAIVGGGAFALALGSTGIAFLTGAVLAGKPGGIAFLTGLCDLNSLGAAFIGAAGGNAPELLPAEAIEDCGCSFGIAGVRAPTVAELLQLLAPELVPETVPAENIADGGPVASRKPVCSLMYPLGGGALLAAGVAPCLA